MNKRTHQRKVLATLVSALMLGFAGGALAQTNAVTGGNTTDNTSAGNANGGGLPQIQQQGDVSYTSGGVGLDESKALQSAAHHWPLSLRFTGPGSDFLADVHVHIVDSKGGDVLTATSRGPYMLVKLPAGHYTVHAAYKDEDKTQAVSVAGAGSARAAFHWNTQ
jgi:hypothetical protein